MKISDLEPKDNTSWFDNNGKLLKQIPKDCVKDIAIDNGGINAIMKWQRDLDFYIPKDIAEKVIEKLNSAWYFKNKKIAGKDTLNKTLLLFLCTDIKKKNNK